MIVVWIWEKEIGEIYPKTDISKDFPLERIKLDEDSIKNKPNNYETKITPTFVFFMEKEEIGSVNCKGESGKKIEN